MTVEDDPETAALDECIAVLRANLWLGVERAMEDECAITAERRAMRVAVTRTLIRLDKWGLEAGLESTEAKCYRIVKTSIQDALAAYFHPRHLK